MEFIVQIAGTAPDLGVIEDALRAVDPAALVDQEEGMLRVAGAFNLRTLASVLLMAGQPVAPEHITQLPSVCCGGCSG
ncbi:hypothetical protein QLQ15_13565 [Lysobacter sp. LF1]|uniref:HMA domain-containing protein n=1 Tax=Lysobacter stagni TaxID=3045172 RepID=A0ABT6XIG0_9GAMM|nr:hypothetical protein [Lysobacter sp. LF1]MDI9239935.1 hypothetical protein [Lysobacter sp. LF1]